MIFAIDGSFFLKVINDTSQNTETKTLLMFVSLVGFHLLLSTQLTAALTPECSDGSMFHPLSPIYSKSPFCRVETVANNALNCQHIIAFDQL